MLERKDKQSPSFVKRVRLRKTLGNGKEAMQSIGFPEPKIINQDRFSVQHHSMDKFIDEKEKKAQLLMQLQYSADQFSKLKPNNNGFMTLTAMKALMKVCRERRKYEQLQGMNILGLDIRKIYADPNHKKPKHFQTQKQQDPNSKRYKRGKSIQRHVSNEVRDKNQTQIQGMNVDLQGCPSKQRMNSPEYKKRFTARGLSKNDTSGIATVNSLQMQYPSSPPKSTKTYLYKKMAGSQNNVRDQTNYVYQKRIKSYTEFLWKLSIAHNIYFNLDLVNENISARSKRLKAFVGYGNNCNMIKGLLKRRFWWQITEQRTNDCMFVWTQIKIGDIFKKQAYSKGVYPQYIKEDQNQTKQMAQTCISLSKRKPQHGNKGKKIGVKEHNVKNCFNFKIMNHLDSEMLQKYYLKYEQKNRFDALGTESNKDDTYIDKTQKINEKLKKIAFLQDCTDSIHQTIDPFLEKTIKNRGMPIVHNHLQNNFYLGNKKALFYNLQQYYTLLKEDVFEYVPLTFHIKTGYKDPQYKRFVSFHQKRAAIIKKQEKIEEQQGQMKKKTRNIWIVKPGENSNQGRGITVIDQIYQLNNIIKGSMRQAQTCSSNHHKNSKDLNSKIQENQTGTFIVQQYIDRPFLYNDRKFDIRHYMLITNLYGTMKAYWYEEGYIRTSAYPFNIHNFQPQIHLTNDAIQKHYPQYGKYEPYNKLSYSDFQNYLNNVHSDKKYSFKTQILPQMKKMAQDAAKSVYTKISPQNLQHNFQIFGLDFMIDKNFRPWLIEINTNPCLDVSCPLLDRIIPYMVEQSLKLSLDLVYPPPSHYPNTAKHYAPYISLQTFKYQLIFDSQTDGEKLRNLYQKGSRNLIDDIGLIQEDQMFKDDGIQIKLEDFT